MKRKKEYKWIRSKEYGDREAYHFTYWTGGTNNREYTSFGIWFRKGGKGVLTATMFWRSPWELDTRALKLELINTMKREYGVTDYISILRPLSMHQKKRVYQWEITYRRDDRPTAEQMKNWFNRLEACDISRHAVGPAAPQYKKGRREEDNP